MSKKSDSMLLAVRFWKLRNPGLQPTVADRRLVEKWAPDFLPLLVENSVEDVRGVIGWIQQDKFWNECTFTPSVLIRNWDKIFSQFRGTRARAGEKKHEWTGTQTWHESRKYIICGPCTICNKTIEEHFPRFWTTHG